MTVNDFKKGDLVQVIGLSKGKGFQGVVKRHGFSGSPATHGHKDQLRMPGSIGSGGIQEVWKGMKMAGRMGGGRVTLKNLEIIDIDPAKNILVIKGALPGHRHSLLLINQCGHKDKKTTIESKADDSKKTQAKKSVSTKKK